MERTNLDDNIINSTMQLKKYLTNDEMINQFNFIIIRTMEYLKTGYNGRITVDFSNHRINGLQVNDFIAGSTQTNYYMDKFI